MTQRAMAYAAHRRVMAMIHAFCWTQQHSGNPFTPDEVARLAARMPILRAWATGHAPASAEPSLTGETL